MWLALEGVDGSGKSTLAERLAARLEPEVVVFPLGPPESPETALDEVVGPPLGLYDPRGSEHVVSDRLHWGNPVYGPIFRPASNVDGYGDFGVAGWRYSEMFLKSRGVVTFLISALLKTVLKRLASRGDGYIPADNGLLIADLIARYEELRAESMTYAGTIVTDDAPTDQVLEQMVELARQAQESVKDVAEHPSYVGAPTVNWLVVCDPDRAVRLSVARGLPHGTWQEAGMVSSGVSVEQLDRLAVATGFPTLVAVGSIPQALEAYVYESEGTFVDDPELAGRALT